MGRLIIYITAAVVISSCSKSDLQEFEAPGLESHTQRHSSNHLAESVFHADPLVNGGFYRHRQARLGITDEHRSNAPVIEPINGKIGFLILGASNSRYEGDAFIARIEADGRRIRKELVVKNGAVPAKDINEWLNPTDDCWDIAFVCLEELRPEEVQIIWFKTDDLRSNNLAFPADPLSLKLKLIDVLELFKSQFPNLKQVYGTGRSYTGFAAEPQQREPGAYHTGWAWRWVVEDQAAGLLPADLPWVSDEIYLWTDGEKMRKDGYQLFREDWSQDGIHLSESGEQKVVDYLIGKFSTMSTSRWFNAKFN